MLKGKLTAAVTAAIMAAAAIVSPFPHSRLIEPIKAEAASYQPKWNATGDVDQDNYFGVADVVLLQKWLLAVPDTHLDDWKAADFCKDDKLNVIDLCLMKRALIESGGLLYHDNYYVNIREPVRVNGGMSDVSGTTNGYDRYDNAQSSTVVIGGHEYHGGFKMWETSNGYPEIDFPLDGAYDTFKFVLGADGADASYPYSTGFFTDSYPTLSGWQNENKAGMQVLIDGKVVDEFILNCHDPVKRYSYNVTGAQKLTIKQVASEGNTNFDKWMYEITVWKGEGVNTGYEPMSEPAGNEAVKLIRDIRPYTIPNNSNTAFYPKYNKYYEDERTTVQMGNVEYTDVLASSVSIAMIGENYEQAFFDLEEKYNYFRFTAGACNVKSTTNSGEAWLTIKGDDEILFEELYSTHALPTDHTVDVSGVRKLEISWSYESGSWDGMTFGIGDAYLATTQEAIDKAFATSSWEAYYKSLPERPVRLLNEVGTFGVFTKADPAYFEGNTKLTTFSMGGEKFYEGFMLLAGNGLIQGSVPCCASFNLAGKYKTISFTTGHITNSKIYKPDVLEVYADGKLLQLIEVNDKDLPQEYTIDVDYCKHLEFISGRETMGSIYRPVIGVANIIAYPDGYVDTDLFEKRVPTDYPSTCDLIDTFGFYGLYKGSMKNDQAGAITAEDGYYDGTSKKNYFTVNGGEKIYKGVTLETSVSLSFDTDNVDGLVVLNLLGFSPLALAASGEAHEASFALANIRNAGYTSVTFTVAPVDDGKGYADETVLLVGADDNDAPAAEITLTKDMEPTEYTVDLGHCERLIFYLRCNEDENSSYPYGIYNITLNK